jgi:hypothetical protein
MGQVNKKRKQIERDLKSLAIVSIVVIGLLSLTLIHNAFANEAAFRAVAEKAWKEIVAEQKTQQVTQTPNSMQYTPNAGTSDGLGNLGYNSVNVMSK